ncbi:hypothetical protein ACFVKB_04060 [Rhodococcus sp. NPDC127530]|uniref:hypothetical protein n=1 Tax=unclassified Rhodococcus (in: high G+C Gram-positive bacteria) TaxID=192944 RepID=UPI0036363FD4
MAVLSCLNTGLYMSSSMLFALARQGDAPRGVALLDRRGVPRNSLLVALVVGFACVALDYFSPESAFAFLVNSLGATILMVYFMIAVTRIQAPLGNGMGASRETSLQDVAISLLPLVAATDIIAVLVSMFSVDSTRSQIISSLDALGVTHQVSARTAFRREQKCTATA